MDPAVFGHRLRHHRKTRGLTLEALGERIGRPAPYLSLLENGKREPTLSQINRLAHALGVTPQDLLSDEPPNRRASLELALDRIKGDPRFRSLGLKELRPSARLPDEALEHVVALYDAWTGSGQNDEVDSVRHAAAQISQWLSSTDGHLADVEAHAAELLDASGHDGVGAVTSRHLNAILTHVGYTVVAVDEVPTQLRSITDEEEGVIHVGQRNSLRTRQARKAILQTVAGRVLGHGPPTSTFDRLRQRVEEAYFAGAVLVPEKAAAMALRTARQDRDLSPEDIKERFYVSYEMAAQRFSNLATHHLDILTHFIHSDSDGIVWKAYQNDGFPLPELAGAHEGRQLCRFLGARTVYASSGRFDIHYQFTDTPSGSFWSATHLTPDANARALTTGVRYADARWFRGRRTSQQETSRCPGGDCCRVAPSAMPKVRLGQRQQAHLVTVLMGEAALDAAEINEFISRRREDRTTESSQSAYADPWEEHERFDDEHL